MKFNMVRLFAAAVMAGYAASSAYADEVAIRGVTITHQTVNSEMFIVKFVVNNNSGATITGARAYADRTYCAKTTPAREAASADTPSIANGGSHTVTLLVPPGDEPYLRLSLRQGNTSVTYAEVTVPRGNYDAKGAVIHACRKVTKPAAPVTAVPMDAIKKGTPKQ